MVCSESGVDGVLSKEVSVDDWEVSVVAWVLSVVAQAESVAVSKRLRQRVERCFMVVISFLLGEGESFLFSLLYMGMTGLSMGGVKFHTLFTI